MLNSLFHDTLTHLYFHANIVYDMMNLTTIESSSPVHATIYFKCYSKFSLILSK